MESVFARPKGSEPLPHPHPGIHLHVHGTHMNARTHAHTDAHTNARAYTHAHRNTRARARHTHARARGHACTHACVRMHADADAGTHARTHVRPQTAGVLNLWRFALPPRLPPAPWPFARTVPSLWERPTPTPGSGAGGAPSSRAGLPASLTTCLLTIFAKTSRLPRVFVLPPRAVFPLPPLRSLRVQHLGFEVHRCSKNPVATFCPGSVLVGAGTRCLHNGNLFLFRSRA